MPNPIKVAFEAVSTTGLLISLALTRIPSETKKQVDKMTKEATRPRGRHVLIKN